MTIQQFADQLRNEECVAPLLQSLQALRKCSPTQVWDAIEDDSDWIPWGVAPALQRS
jgi:hypothetical protein